MNLDERIDEMGWSDLELLKADGYDDAAIGVTFGAGHPEAIVYNRDLIMEILIVREGMTAEEAEEWIGYNIEGAYVGEHTPLIMTPLEGDRRDKEIAALRDIISKYPEAAEELEKREALEDFLLKL